MIHFQGDRTFNRPPAEVYAKLGDPAFLLTCLKDVEAGEISADRAVWKMHPALTFIRTTLDVTMDILERIPNDLLRIKLFSRGIGATSTVETVLKIQSADSGTTVHWSADITELTGLLKMAPKGLLTSTAGKVIEETWTEIAHKLAPKE